MRRAIAAAALPALLLAGCGGQPSGDQPQETGEADTVAESPPPPPPVVPTTAMGEQIFKRCAACHTITPDGPNGIGPNLHGIVGRAVASKDGYTYSAAMTAKGGSWDAASLDTYLTAPMKVVPGTKMAFAGIPDAADRAALILYLTDQSK